MRAQVIMQNHKQFLVEEGCHVSETSRMKKEQEVLKEEAERRERVNRYNLDEERLNVCPWYVNPP